MYAFRLSLALVALAAALMAVPSSVVAQDGKKPDGAKTAPLSEKLETIDTKEGLLIRKPDGWVTAAPAKGTVAVLRAAGDSTSRIEFRLAPGMDSGKAALYFNSFHTNLQTAGLKKVVDAASKTYGENVGTQTEYETSSAKKKYRLVVWQTHRGEKAWLVVAFLEEEAREDYLEDYSELISTLAFK